jgi:glycosyltransferase involved in cell wall biosynthesis
MKKTIFIFSILVGCLICIPLIKKTYEKRFCRPYLTVVGFSDMSDGLGRQSIEIMDTMREYVSVGFRPTRKSVYRDVPSAVQNIMKKQYSKFGKVVLYEDIIYTTTNNFLQRRFDLNRQDQIRIAYSMFESSEIPKLWVHNFNLYFDAVVVPDDYHVDVYKNSGVTLPIFVLPLGLNLKPLLKDSIKTKAHTPFVFANFSTCISRKNHDELIKAFYVAFGNNPDIHLWINCKYSRENLFEHLKKQVEDLGVSNILLTNHCYNNTEYRKNFHKIDCYVSFSQSEGFSIQPREAMALGIPCIISDNTAQSTICKSGLVKTVSCPIKEPAYYEHFHDIFGFRYNIDFNQSVEALKEVYSHYDHYLSQSAKLRKWAHDYDYEQLKPFYKSLIKPKNVILGEENRIEENTLITNSQKLYAKYKAIE